MNTQNKIRNLAAKITAMLMSAIYLAVSVNVPVLAQDVSGPVTRGNYGGDVAVTAGQSSDYFGNMAGVSATDNNTKVSVGNNLSVTSDTGFTVTGVYVTGAELLEALEASTYCTPEAVGGFPQTSGIEWVLDTSVAFDQGEIYTLNGKESSYYAPASIGRVTIKTINGEAFDENATYAVVTNNFCAAGGDTYNVFNRAYAQGFGFDTGIPMDEAVMDYVAVVLNGVIGQEYAEPSALASQIG